MPTPAASDWRVMAACSSTRPPSGAQIDSDRRSWSLEPERGATAELIHQGEVVGMAVRLRKEATPVYVSAGHKMDLPTAVQIVQMVGMGYREPETTRRAHRLVNELRRQANASQTSIDR